MSSTPFRMDLRAGCLMHGDQAIPLRPKTWAVLQYLAERPGSLATKDELLSALWPGVTVGEDTLNKSIGELRAVLGDQVKTPRYIETVHRRGFRFVGKIGRDLAFDAEEPLAEPNGGGAPARLLVGRTTALGQLANLLARARAGERQLVFVSGPAGIGKSALVEAFLASPEVRASPTTVWVASGLCIQQHGHSPEPYMPVLDALDRLARRPEAGEVARLLGHVAPMWLAQIPWLRDDEVAAPEGPQTLPLPGTARMLREFAAFVESLTAADTLVLVLEDLHWSDPSTVDLLSLLGQRRDPARLLVIGTYRPAEVAVHEHVLATVLETLRLRRQCVEMSLHELAVDDVRAYLDQRFPGAELTDRLAPVIHEHTDGHPLFMVALVDHLLSRGSILDTAPGWALSTDPAHLDLGVPDDIRLMIETQIAVLSPLQRKLLEVASVTHTGFTTPIVAKVLETRADDAEALIQTLMRPQQFLREADPADWPGSSVTRHYAFTHELYRQVVYDGIAAKRRARLHRRIGVILETVYAERVNEIAPMLAIHFERGDDPARAVGYLVLAAARARQRFANREAIAFLEPALVLVARLPRGRERRRRELAIRLALAQPLHELLGFSSERVHENAERAYALGVELGSPAQLFPIMYSLWFLHVMRADPTATVMASRLDELARRFGTTEARLEVDSVLVRTAVYEGRFDDARCIAERRLVPEGHAAELAPAYGADPIIAAQCHYAYALWFLGHPDRAQLAMRDALARARVLGSPFTLAAALCHSSLLEAFRRDPRAIRPLLDEATVLTAAHGFALWSAVAAVLGGWAEVQLGRTDQGISAMERGIAAYRDTGARMVSTYFLAFLAEARWSAGAFAEGLAVATEGLQLADTTLDRGYRPELWRLKGELLLAPKRAHSGGRATSSRHDPSVRDAERCLLQALDSARTSQAKSLELRAAMSLARAWRTMRRAADGRALLREVYEGFGDVASPDLSEARSLLGELAIRGTRTRDVRRGARPSV